MLVNSFNKLKLLVKARVVERQAHTRTQPRRVSVKLLHRISYQICARYLPWSIQVEVACVESRVRLR